MKPEFDDVQSNVKSYNLGPLVSGILHVEKMTGTPNFYITGNDRTLEDLQEIAEDEFVCVERLEDEKFNGEPYLKLDLYPGSTDFDITMKGIFYAKNGNAVADIVQEIRDFLDISIPEIDRSEIKPDVPFRNKTKMGF